MLDDADEFRHTPVNVENWQENYVWHAWSHQARSGFNLHLGRIHDHGLLDLRAHVVIDGQITATSGKSSGDDCFGVPGLEIDVKVPFERHTLRYQGIGARGPNAGGWYGMGAADTPFGFEIDVVTPNRPFQSSSFAEILPITDLGGDHYEFGGTWSGRLWSGDREVMTSGLLVRDHSWGGRIWTFEEVFWVPMVFDDARQFVFNLSWREKQIWHSLSARIDDAGEVTEHGQSIARVSGNRIPRQFDAAMLLSWSKDHCRQYDVLGDIHIPIGRAHSRVGLSDMYSTVSDGERSGFCTLQVMPSEAEVSTGFAEPLPQYA